MTTQTSTPEPDRILRGLDQLLTAAGAWLTAADHETAGRTRAALGRATGGGVAAWFTGGLAYELGPIAWGAAGGLLALSVWVAGAPDDTESDDEDQEDTEEAEMEDDDQLLDTDAFAELVHDVARGGNVHLTAIGHQLFEETGREYDVLALCRAAGIPTKAVRVPGADPAVTTGIHRLDLPPLPPPLPTPPVDVVSAGQHANNNTNNTTEQIGEGAAVIIKTAPTPRQHIHP
ncbi:hypothetical protein [Actinacidiphila sp. ITFR-21]|uniref:hypothetical protein n=1 Tax=Actinacidiphila sp. ITFR-21 TaxID=3075199 RepID=UPI00288ACC7E|nr:hypothetical protein [Streptomyces sp. ITFR-21]WNI16925.1 hypothetical protein RLT57_16275 [Streptomyces sp. ITFR-21]